MTPLERAARALHIEDCRAHGATAPDWSTVADGRKEMLRDQARAVLTAIREPSEAMVDRGTSEIPYDDDHGVDREMRAKACWESMIDAALTEGGK